MAQQRHQDTTNSIQEICASLRTSRATLYRYLKSAPQGG
jgi:predicted transcriptional regulator YheO